MDKNDPNAVQAISPGKFGQAVTGVKVEAPLPEILLPALFGLLVSVIIRFHSLASMATMARTVCSLLALVSVAYFLLLAAGKRINVSRAITATMLALAFRPDDVSPSAVAAPGPLHWAVCRRIRALPGHAHKAVICKMYHPDP